MRSVNELREDCQPISPAGSPGGPDFIVIAAPRSVGYYTPLPEIPKRHGPSRSSRGLSRAGMLGSAQGPGIHPGPGGIFGVP